MRRNQEKPEIHRYNTLKSLHPALRFQSGTVLSGRRFAPSFASSETSSTDSESVRHGPVTGAQSRWPSNFYP